MAHAYTDRRRILVPAAPGTLIFTPPPAPPLLPPAAPVAPARFLVPPGSSAVVLKPGFPSAFLVQDQVLLRVEPPMFVVAPSRPPPRVIPLSPAASMQLDEMRTRSLLKFMADEGLEPSAEEEFKREHVIAQLKWIVLAWIKKVAWSYCLPNDVIEATSATIFTYGSYGLGVHGSESDIDALCVGPHFASLEEDFFISLFNMLANRPEVSELQRVKSAKVPLMRFRFNGISIDLPYAQLPTNFVPDNLNIYHPSLSGMVDETSWRSLSGVRANKCILELVPNLKNFQCLLRCVKLWAKKRGIYGHLFGFFGGIHLAILAAYVCRIHPSAGVGSLIVLFFGTFSQWPWPKPVVLHDQYLPYRNPDGRLLMPIMMPCSPYEWCYSNITKSTFNKIISELHRGFSLIKFQDFRCSDFRWDHVFEAFPYAAMYSCFLRIFLVAPNGDKLKDWVGWVKSRIRGLLLKVELLQIYCDPNPTQYVDHNAVEANAVFYWGLLPNGRKSIDIKSLQDDFMKCVNADSFMEGTSNQCKLELTIVERSQLPKNLLHEVI